MTHLLQASDLEHKKRKQAHELRMLDLDFQYEKQKRVQQLQQSQQSGVGCLNSTLRHAPMLTTHSPQMWGQQQQQQQQTPASTMLLTAGNTFLASSMVGT